jgi:hypothetical protein
VGSRRLHVIAPVLALVECGQRVVDEEAVILAFNFGAGVDVAHE